MTVGETPLISFLKRVLDPAIVVACLIAAVFASGDRFHGYYLILGVITFFVSAHVFYELDLFRSWSKSGFTARIRDILFGWIIVVAILLFLGYASNLSSEYSKQTMLLWFSVAPIGLLLSHILVRGIVTRVRSDGNVRTVVIAGASGLGLQMAKKIKEDPYLFMEVVGFFDDRSERLAINNEEKLLGSFAQLSRYVKQHRINLIYIALPMTMQPRILRLLEELHDTTASVYFIPDIFVFDLVQARFDDVNGIPVIAVCETPFTSIDGVIKRASDLIVGCAILLVLAPLMAAIALGVKLSSPGPVLFRQRRYGLDGEEIVVYKFRSMTVAEDTGEVVQAVRGDKRITPFGAFLRKTSFDELPQLFNVLQGRMSIVGPRPHAVAHNELYRKLIKGYMLRHKVKPGITGWAQINGFRGETETLDKMKLRIECDIDYLRNWSLYLDLSIILRTVLLMFRDPNAY